MNQTSKEQLLLFVESVLDDECGINKESHSLLMQLLVSDKDIANILHESVELVRQNAEGRFVL